MATISQTMLMNNDHKQQNHDGTHQVHGTRVVEGNHRIRTSEILMCNATKAIPNQ